MSSALGLLAMILLGAEDAPPRTIPPAPLVHPAAAAGRTEPGHRGETPTWSAASDVLYELRVVEVEGVGWREAVHAQLHPIVRRNGATVWTTTESVARALTERPGATTVQAPKITARQDSPAHVTVRSPRAFVGEQVRPADAPVSQASYVPYKAKVDQVREGFTATFSGRKLDQGVLTKVVFEDTCLTALHTVLLSQTAEGNETAAGTHARTSVPVQVPEISRSDIAGEWLIPSEGVLLVSLGAHTVADASGKAVVRERLLVLAAKGVDEANEAPRTAVWSRALGEQPERTAGLMPVLPSRSLPQPHDAHGPVPLPPLPEEASPPSTLPDSSEPCATPQARPSPGMPAPPSPADTAIQQTSRASSKVNHSESTCQVASATLCAGEPARMDDAKKRAAAAGAPRGLGLDWATLWFLEQPSHTTPFPTHTSPAHDQPEQGAVHRVADTAAPKPPAAPSPTPDDDGMMTVTVVFKKRISNITLPAGEVLREAAKFFVSSLSIPSVAGNLSAPLRDMLDKQTEEFAERYFNKGPQAKTDSKVEKTEAKQKEDKAAKSSAAAAPHKLEWKPKKASLFRFPVDGTMIEIRITPEEAKGNESELDPCDLESADQCDAAKAASAPSSPPVPAAVSSSR